MKIYELLANVADNELRMQGLNAAITNVTAGKLGNKVTFATDAINPGMLLNPDEMPVCILVCIDRAAWDREFKKETPNRG
ncbi:hypothetical protein [Burkholderia cenocepacia]|uniref:hypothetical protein n=1 Tax=Burkholderia cenocepacia TaxID=95486 RepID=UPI002876E799|nr:hypothetical protein [Burkholderia cenocepacia]MDS0801748.1 hypothetical protein [Burkholderia cenocepacia]